MTRGHRWRRSLDIVVDFLDIALSMRFSPPPLEVSDAPPLEDSGTPSGAVAVDPEDPVPDARLDLDAECLPTCLDTDFLAILAFLLARYRSQSSCCFL